MLTASWAPWEVNERLIHSWDSAAGDWEQERGTQRADAQSCLTLSSLVGVRSLFLLENDDAAWWGPRCAWCDVSKTAWLSFWALSWETVVQEEPASTAWPVEGVFSLVLLFQTVLRQERGWRYLWVGYGVNYQARIQHGAAEIFLERITDSLCASVDLSEGVPNKNTTRHEH